MDNEILKSFVDQLWIILPVIAFTITIILFRKPIYTFLSHLQNFSIQHKETQISAKTEQNKEETTADKQIQEMAIEDDKDSPEEKSLVHFGRSDTPYRLRGLPV